MEREATNTERVREERGNEWRVREREGARMLQYAYNHIL